MSDTFFFDPSKSIEELYTEYQASNVSDKSIENFVSSLPESLLFSDSIDVPQRDLPVFNCDDDIITFLSGLPKSALNTLNTHSIPEVTVEYIKRFDNNYIYSVNGKHVSLQSNVKCSVKDISCGELEYALRKDASALFAFINPFEVFKLGATNGLKVLMAAFPAEVYVFFLIRSIENYMLPYPSRFNSFTKQLFGSTITFKADQAVSNEVIKIYHLHKVVGDNIFKYKKEALLYVRSIFDDEFKTVNNEDITVSYGGPSENNLSYTFLINDQELSIAHKNLAFNKVTTSEIYELCKNLLSVVKNNGPLKEYVDKYGHSFVFSILQIIAFEETVSFFINKGKEIIASHQLLHPHLLLKDYGFTSSKSNQKFLDIILCKLELLIEENKNNYIANNVFEYSKNDYWNIFYLKAETLAFFKFDFTKISNIQLRHEFILFMREYVKHHSHSASATTFGRISYVLKKLTDDTESILSVTRADVVNIFSQSETDNHKSHTVYKCLTITGVFFNYINASKDPLKKVYSNPFYSIDHIDDTDNIIPPDIQDIRKMLKNCSAVERHIKLAFMLLLATGGRVNEITNLKTDEIEFNTENGEAIIKKVLYKTIEKSEIPFVKIKLSKDLSLLLKQFIEDTEYIRSQLDKPFVFVYRNKHKRKNSLNPYKVLNSFVLKDGVKKWAVDVLGDSKGRTITPRSIRTLVGTELFKYGYTASEISDILGNTSDVAEKHYINLSVADEAAIYHKFYKQNFAHIFSKNDSEIIDPIVNTTLLGVCQSSTKCNRGNDCSTCKNRIGCSKNI